MTWLFVIGIFLLGIGIGWMLRGAGSGSAEALPRIEKPPVTSPAELESAVVELVREGKKIHAIKLYREFHGVGLKEAKDAVDAIDASRG